MGKIDLEIMASNISAYSEGGSREVKATVEDVDEDELMDNFTIADLIGHFGAEDFLEEIGKEAALEYFSVEDEE